MNKLSLEGKHTSLDWDLSARRSLLDLSKSTLVYV